MAKDKEKVEAKPEKKELTAAEFQAARIAAKIAAKAKK